MRNYKGIWENASEREWMKFCLLAEESLIIPVMQDFYLALKQRESVRPFYKMCSFVKVKGVNVSIPNDREIGVYVSNMTTIPETFNQELMTPKAKIRSIRLEAVSFLPTLGLDHHAISVIGIRIGIPNLIAHVIHLNISVLILLPEATLPLYPPIWHNPLMYNYPSMSIEVNDLDLQTKGGSEVTLRTKDSTSVDALLVDLPPKQTSPCIFKSPL
ncbi:hypothetical protein Gotur_002858 [Gossypium turneri]